MKRTDKKGKQGWGGHFLSGFVITPIMPAPSNAQTQQYKGLDE